MSRIRQVLTKPLGHESVRDPLNTLTRQPHGSSHRSHRQRFMKDRSQHLPPCGREHASRGQAVCSVEEEAIQPKHAKHQTLESDNI
jgi:hypothetical protein